MGTAYQVLTPPTTEPISLTEAKAYCRIDYPDEDVLVARLIVAARQQAEAITHRAISTQTIKCINTLERPSGGELSGPITNPPSWYQFQEQLGANPFGANQFYFDLPLPPCQSVTSIQTKITVWDPWTVFTGTTYLDSVQEPARIYFQAPPTANQWLFQYVAGYDGVNFFLPADLRQTMLDSIAFWYDHREGDPLPDDIMSRYLRHRVDWI